MAQKYLEAQPLHALQLRHRYTDYALEGVPFSGTLKKHPYDPHKVLLWEPPFKEEAGFYEFIIDDILHVELEATLGTEEGLAVQVVTVWVRKGTRAVKIQPFVV
ncbi:hypothetical protein [Spirochaeta thermophila]|uniref:Uncharacterized protein n=2 Tax=Winmispira thermophila TaxID=154 RepID=G0GER5_WINT7|nr:hypothetical protein [Spirochaeta thermophila]ADN02108.1 hypothetical protein STHERM_c11660 [Spirochaeta thermophila DSM 6192]AEJ61471.1 hypothetical protein Spith_1201 [Spirochaeta thermophila DSM 6578]